MSLDVHLVDRKKVFSTKHSGIFIRKNGGMKEISEEEWYKLHPDQEPVKFLGEEEQSHEAYSGNITHNLGVMADKAGIYFALWRPEEKGWKKAKDIIKVLRGGLQELKDKPEYFKQFDDENNWGTYEQFVPFVEEYLAACIKYPSAEIVVSR